MLTYVVQKCLTCQVLNSVKFWNIQVTTLLNANRMTVTVIIRKCQVIFVHNSIYIFYLFRWAWVTVVHTNFMPIMSRFWSILRISNSSLTLCVDNGTNNTGSYRFNSASADEATNTGSAVIYHTCRLNNAWVHPAYLTKSNCISIILHVLGLVNDQTGSWLFIFHTCWNPSIQNSRAYIMNASAVFADRFARFWMMT